MAEALKVSVAIPVYNAAKHLRECLDSVVNQTISQEEIEIICVNDKSKDNSLEILKEYEALHPNIVVIDREHNSGGASAPRNNAIEAAKGEYIFFLDSDDYLGLEALERLYNFAAINNSDAIFGKYKGVNGRGVPQSMFTGNIADADIIKNKLVYAISPQKMFKTSLVKEWNMRFLTDAKTAEDQVFVMEFFTKCEKVSILSDYDYYYLTNREEGHLSASYVPPEEYFNVIGKVIDVIENGNIKNKVYKDRVIGAYLNRFLHFGRNSKFFESKSLSLEKKKAWMFYYSRFLQEKIKPEIDSLVNPEFKIRLKCIRENNLEKLQKVEEFKKKVKSANITGIEDGNIIAELKISNKNQEINEKIIVNSLSRAKAVLGQAEIEQEILKISGQFNNSLLSNIETQYTLMIVNRKTKEKKEFKETSSLDFSVSGFIFNVYLKDIVFSEEDAGIWDVSVVANTGGRKVTKRLGADRLKEPEAVDKNFKFISGVTNFAVKPYLTLKDDNLSLDIQVKQSSV